MIKSDLNISQILKKGSSLQIRHKHKFNAKISEYDGIKFSSKKECAFYHKLKTLKSLGEVLFFLRQVGFDLPGGTRYFADFQVFYKNGEVVFYDVKGFATETFILKKKQVEALYPITIEVIK